MPALVGHGYGSSTQLGVTDPRLIEIFKTEGPASSLSCSKKRFPSGDVFIEPGNGVTHVMDKQAMAILMTPHPAIGRRSPTWLATDSGGARPSRFGRRALPLR